MKNRRFETINLGFNFSLTNSRTALGFVSRNSDCNTNSYSLASNSNSAKKKRRSRKPIVEEFVIPNASNTLQFQFVTQLYSFTSHLAEYRVLYGTLYPQLMSTRNKCYISTEQKGIGCLDMLFTTFCQYMGMRKVKHLPNDCGEKVFCWLGKRRANEILSALRPNHHTVNRLPLDIYLKDKQSLANAMKGSMFQKRINYPAHKCRYSEGNMVSFQLLCPHQYAKHSFQPCTEPGCFERLSYEARTELGVDVLHSGPFCPCFTGKHFVPETKVFTSSAQQFGFLVEIANIAPESQWIVKPSYMRSGRGIRVLSSVDQLREFLKVQTCQRFMWGQDYVVQRYIKNPLLTDKGQKFDIRMFLLVVVCRFWRVLGFLHPGYVRKVVAPYHEMGAGDKFEPAKHLASTRVWMQAMAKKANAADADGKVVEKRQYHEQIRHQQQQQQNSAAISKDEKAGEKIAKIISDPLEPVPLIGFFHNCSFENDECEEYNYAVRHGCLKNNTGNLPLILGTIDRNIKTPQIASNERASITGAKKSSKRLDSTEEKVGLSAEDISPIEQLTSNKEFVRCLKSMVSQICQSVFHQIKTKSNCYQLFSLDICIDEHGKPWLLEVNPSIVTECVNWDSNTIRQVIPAVFIESLSLANECIKKSHNFLALRTSSQHPRKPNDLVFRQNFIWMYSTPARYCNMFELKTLKYSIDSLFKAQQASNGIAYQPVDYYPDRNKRRSRNASQQPVSNNSSKNVPRCSYRFPTPVISVPVLEEDIAYSKRYMRIQLDTIARQSCVRRLEMNTNTQISRNKHLRYQAYQDNLQRPAVRKRGLAHFD